MHYEFKKYLPNIRRGQRFPDDIIRVSRSSLVISKNIIDKYVGHIFTNDNGDDRVCVIFNVDNINDVIDLTFDDRGYTLQIRENGNAYLNTTRMSSFNLTIGDYKLGKDGFFYLAK